MKYKCLYGQDGFNAENTKPPGLRGSERSNLIAWELKPVSNLFTAALLRGKYQHNLLLTSIIGNISIGDIFYTTNASDWQHLEQEPIIKSSHITSTLSDFSHKLHLEENQPILRRDLAGRELNKFCSRFEMLMMTISNGSNWLILNGLSFCHYQSNDNTTHKHSMVSNTRLSL